MFCMMCGKELKDDARFCQYCGAKVKNPAGEEVTKEVVQEPVKNEIASEPVRTKTATAKKVIKRSGAGIQAAGAAAHHGQAAVRHAVNYKLLTIIAVAVTAIAMMIYVFWFQSGTPEDTIDKLEGALNEMNQTEVLECFDEQTQDLYSGSLSVAGSLAGIDLSGLGELANGLGGIMAGAGLSPEFDLSIQGIEYTSDDTCLVTVQMSVSYQGTSETETQQLPMKKEGREWLISMAAAANAY
ncbi:MAG: zinc ribbon domain-containing protein [Lachnospiraceae bacterium]|nr:zinc ribbon domain-containing protein [Lachnospiraceae bacterium]